MIPNDRLLEITEKRVSLSDAFGVADDVLRQGIQGITEVITVPGLVNLDFADVKTIMSEGGAALMAVGRGLRREARCRCGAAGDLQPAAGHHDRRRAGHPVQHHGRSRA